MDRLIWLAFLLPTFAFAQFSLETLPTGSRGVGSADTGQVVYFASDQSVARYELDGASTLVPNSVNFSRTAIAKTTGDIYYGFRTSRFAGSGVRRFGSDDVITIIRATGQVDLLRASDNGRYAAYILQGGSMYLYDHQIRTARFIASGATELSLNNNGAILYTADGLGSRAVFFYDGVSSFLVSDTAAVEQRPLLNNNGVGIWISLGGSLNESGLWRTVDGLNATQVIRSAVITNSAINDNNAVASPFKNEAIQGLISTSSLYYTADITAATGFADFSLVTSGFNNVVLDISKENEIIWYRNVFDSRRMLSRFDATGQVVESYEVAPGLKDQRDGFQMLSPNGTTFAFSSKYTQKAYVARKAPATPPDADDDGIPDSDDNCPDIRNADQTDTDDDAEGDACDLDDDSDGILDETDNCPLSMNPGQEDFDGDGAGDYCDSDDDGDQVLDAIDMCLFTPTGAITNTDGCAIADLCPCIHPDGSDKWKNHGKYVSCVAYAAKYFKDAFLISDTDHSDLVSGAGMSACGVKN